MSTPLTAGSLAELELTNDGTKLVSLVFGINLYTNQSFYETPQELLATFQAFQARFPAAALKFHATETMRVHKPVTTRVLGMLDKWMAPDAPRKHYVALELKASVAAEDAPTAKYEVWSADASKQANVVSIALPASLALDQADTLADFVCELADAFRLRSGLAGFAMECSRYDKRKSEAHAWSVGMRNVGVDIVRLPYDAKAVGSEGIKGVGWLTLLGADLVEELGGEKAIRAKLSKDIAILPRRHGLVIEAGPAPALGDLNRGETLPLYREVYRLLEQGIDQAARTSMYFSGLTGDEEAATIDWYKRLAR